MTFEPREPGKIWRSTSHFHRASWGSCRAARWQRGRRADRAAQSGRGLPGEELAALLARARKAAAWLIGATPAGRSLSSNTSFWGESPRRVPARGPAAPCW